MTTETTSGAAVRGPWRAFALACALSSACVFAPPLASTQAAVDAGFDAPDVPVSLDVCAAGACVDRVDVPPACEGPDRGMCHSACVSLTDLTNCGTCGHACPAPPTGATALCNHGVCSVSTLTCPADLRDCDGAAANGCETSVLTDPAHCGDCAVSCPATGGAASCAAGHCAIACSAGLGDCDGMAANGCETATATSPAHCGACGRACALANATAGCAVGACTVAACAAGFGDCDGTAPDGCETNLGADNRNCGACGHACPGGTACVDATCQVTCAAGQRVCSGACVNDQTDNANCGACGTACAAGTVCSAGLCTSTCAAGTTVCSGVCRDLANDPNNCMTCGHACSFTHGVAGCRMGGCFLAACEAGFADCDGAAANGCETSTGTDASNCGVCGNRCQFANAGASCAAGRCAMGSCNAGFRDCDASPIDGCEVNTAAGDVGNCGGCGTRCPAPPVGTSAVCVASVCGTSSVSCPSDRRDCNAMSADGCEATILTDANNCGGCGTRCGSTGGTASCAGGVCAIACAAGLGNCDGNVANGCETNVTTSATNCGGCNRVCSVANATASCVAGACGLASCNAGFGDCDGAAADGCERNLNSDNANCGACGNACPSGRVCSAGTCQVSCGSLAMCGGTCRATAIDPDNCGACGTVCAATGMATRTCGAGACNGVCASGRSDCDASLQTNGCETDVNTTATACGGCGMACSTSHLTAACAGGACTGACDAGYADCDANRRSNGCETPTATDVNNCGGCGVICPTQAHASATCAAGVCGFACAAGFRNCDAMDADGCEADLSLSGNCGACGVSCTAGQSCVQTAGVFGCM